MVDNVHVAGFAIIGEILMMRIEFSREIWYKDFTFERNFPEPLNLAYIDLRIFAKDSLILNLMQIIRIKYFYLNPY